MHARLWRQLGGTFAIGVIRVKQQLSGYHWDDNVWGTVWLTMQIFSVLCARHWVDGSWAGDDSVDTRCSDVDPREDGSGPIEELHRLVSTWGSLHGWRSHSPVSLFDQRKHDIRYSRKTQFTIHLSVWHSRACWSGGLLSCATAHLSATHPMFHVSLLKE